MQHELSLIDAAVVLLRSVKKPMDIYQLFDKITEASNFTEDKKNDLIAKFYSDLITSGKFVYTGENEWDLKDNQKIELWEKDGSFYKEYNEVEMSDEYKEMAKAAKVVKTPKVKKTIKAVVDVVEEVVEEVIVEEPVVVKEEVQVKPKETVVEPAVTPAVTPDEVYDAFEEEVFEEYDEFDEEKYNEYMDTYEDQYDD